MTVGVKEMEKGQTQRRTYRRVGVRWAVHTAMEPPLLSQQPGTLSAFVRNSTERRR